VFLLQHHRRVQPMFSGGDAKVLRRTG
jgi:hypothetical protein